MQRRSFLKTAAAATVGIGMEGCIAGSSRRRGMAVARMEWIAFDTGLARAAGYRDQLQAEETRAVQWVLPALRITAENGASGACVGVGGLYEAMVRPAVLHAAKGASWLVGHDASLISNIRTRLLEEKSPAAIMSMIDIALWDLYGNVEHAALADLLGPRLRDRVRCYLSTPPNLGSLSDYVAHAEAAQAAGYTGYKIHPYWRFNPVTRRASTPDEPGAFPEHDVAIFREVRRQLGDSLVLMADNYMTYDFPQALWVGGHLDDLGFAWFESPMPERPSWTDAYRGLRAAIRTPVCAPETLPGPYLHRERWVTDCCADIGRIDVTFGGFTDCLALLRGAADHGFTVDLHNIPMAIYHLPLYAVFGEGVLPWKETHGSAARGPTPEAVQPFRCGDRRRPWIIRSPDTRTDTEGFCHLSCPLPGMGLEYDWEFIRGSRTDGVFLG